MKPDGRDEWIRQEWRHSHEEDTADTRVFRPASFPFPPSRGRAALDLRRAQAFGLARPGPGDRSQGAEGVWSLTESRLTLQKADGTAEVHEIVALAPDRLVLKKPRA